MDSGALAKKLASFRQILQAFHKGNPPAGANKEEFRSRAFPDAPPSVFEVLLATSKDIELAGEYVRLQPTKSQCRPTSTKPPHAWKLPSNAPV